MAKELRSSATQVRPFIDFYRQNRISPVSQDVSDLRKHFSRRDFLYRSLGLSPLGFAGRSVIEMGPGSGHNALYVASRQPARYVLVDANPTGEDRARALLHEHFPGAGFFEFVRSDILEFSTDERFDIVLCEGVIPHQKEPVEFARHVASLVKPGGVLVLTTADHLSAYAEVLRRVFALYLAPLDLPVVRRVELLRPVMDDHLQTLPGRSRPTDDWILDNLINPWRGKLFSMADAINALADDFDAFGSSPRMLTDWRWYKDVVAGRQRLNELALEIYARTQLSFLDYRSPPLDADPAAVREVAVLAQESFEAMVAYECGDRFDLAVAVADRAERVAGFIARLMPATARAFEEAAAYLRNRDTADPLTCLREFRHCCGRSQQYMSFVRSLDYLSSE